jgi:hypothetical protein
MNRHKQQTPEKTKTESKQEKEMIMKNFLRFASRGTESPAAWLLFPYCPSSGAA